MAKKWRSLGGSLSAVKEALAGRQLGVARLALARDGFDQLVGVGAFGHAGIAVP